MPGLEYHHIGHDPSRGEIALWCVDEQYEVHEERRRFAEADASWLAWSHDRSFGGRRRHAVGRVELDRQAGSIYISDPIVGFSPERLTRVIDAVTRRYPRVRWFLFGAGFKGESVMTALARRVAAADAAELTRALVEAENQAAACADGVRERGPTPEIKLGRGERARR